MLLQLQNRNFQSHENVLFRFVPGINLIIGSSRKGKTVVRRALTFLKDNRPTGNAYVSWWDRDNKKNPKTIHEVKVQVDDENYSTICRMKAPDFNGYEVWNYESDEHGAPAYSFEAIGTNVPEEITNLLNLSEVNIQRQWDQPFLLSESPGKVAEFFNKIIKLDLIDEVLSKAESMRRQNNRDIETNKKLQEDIVKQIEELSWVKEATEQITQIDNNRITLIQKQDVFNRIKNLVDQFHQYEEELEVIPENLDEPLKLMEQIESIHESREYKEDKVDEIGELIEKYDKCCDELEEIQKFDFAKAEKLMIEIEKLENKIVKKEQELDRVTDIRMKFAKKHENETYLKHWKKEEKKLIEQLPPQCPTCGQPVNKEMLI